MTNYLVDKDIKRSKPGYYVYAATAVVLDEIQEQLDIHENIESGSRAARK